MGQCHPQSSHHHHHHHHHQHHHHHHHHHHHQHQHQHHHYHHHHHHHHHPLFVTKTTLPHLLTFTVLANQIKINQIKSLYYTSSAEEAGWFKRNICLGPWALTPMPPSHNYISTLLLKILLQTKHKYFKRQTLVAGVNTSKRLPQTRPDHATPPDTSHGGPFRTNWAGCLLMHSRPNKSTSCILRQD